MTTISDARGAPPHTDDPPPGPEPATPPGRPVTATDAVVLLHGHDRHLVGIAANLVGDVETARDVVQDVVEALLRLDRTFTGDEHVLAYARRAVVNRSRSSLRRRGSLLRLAARARDAHAPGADEAVLLADEHRTVLAHLQTLPDRQREVLVLRHFARLSDAEVAEAMGIAEGTVRSHASRGIAALSRLLGGTDHD